MSDDVRNADTPANSQPDPLAPAVARGRAVKAALLVRAGGALTTAEVAALLGVSTEEVEARRRCDALLAVSLESGEVGYPAIQFGSDGVVPGLERVLAAFVDSNPWTRLAALTAPADALGGRTMLQALAAGETDRVTALAASLGEQLG